MTTENLNFWQKLKKSKFTNKYVIIIVAFSVFIIFFDSNSTIKRWRVKRENTAIKKEIKHYKEQMTRDSTTIEVLKHNTGNLEQYAREKYNIKRPDEDVYIIEE